MTERPSNAGPLWEDVGRLITKFRGTLRDRPVGRAITRTEIEEALLGFDFAKPKDLGQLTRDVAELLARYSTQVTHPRYFGLFNPSVREAGIVAETLAATFNPQLAVWSHSPIANEFEQHVLRALSAVLGLNPLTTFANFTTGGAEANLTAVLVAIANRFPEWSKGGVSAIGARPRIYLSTDAHGSFEKAVRACGLGTDCLRYLAACAPTFSFDSQNLEQAIIEDEAAGFVPLMVVATAGTTGTGAVDPIGKAADIARRHGAWLHVDAAWAGAAALSPHLKHAISGIELADSITWDAHKWLSVPFSAGMFFCRHEKPVLRAFEVTASYMPASTVEAVDPYLTTIQWGRRAIGLKVFMALAELGLDDYRGLIEHQAAMGDYLRTQLRSHGFEIANDTPLPVICFTHPSIAFGARSSDSFLSRLYARGRVWISEVRPNRGAPLLRACITSYNTHEDDVDLLIDELKLCLVANR